MHIDLLANELLLHIFAACDDLVSTLALAATSRRLQNIFNGPGNRLSTLFRIAERQHGPLDEAIRLLTFNASQSPHVMRPLAGQSEPLLHQIHEVGLVANAWADLYPMKKWRGIDSLDRRCLNSDERHGLRRACYRSWLFTLAFHTSAYTRTLRALPMMTEKRAKLVRCWSTEDLYALLDLQRIFRAILQDSICPSNDFLLQRYRDRYSNDACPKMSEYFNSRHFGTRLSPSSGSYEMIKKTPHDIPEVPVHLFYQSRPTHFLEGWGNEVSHYYVLEDMLKLNPAQLLHLHQTILAASLCPERFRSKLFVETFIDRLPEGGEWFLDNGETLAQTVELVLARRRLLKEDD